MKELQNKLDFLLEKYSVAKAATILSPVAASIDGETLPLFAHRCERRFIELKNIVCGGTLVGISVMRVARIVEKGTDLYEELAREFDICRFVLQRKIVQVTVMENQNVLNAIATCEDGVVITLEISATLKKGEPAKDKHEIISQRGIACDVVVDAQLHQDSIYLFTEENKKFTDVDFELYGLSIDQIAIVRAAFLLAQKECFCDVKAEEKELAKLVELAKESAKSGERKAV